jgi:uncharacterized OsmC-like protein
MATPPTSYTVHARSDAERIASITAAATELPLDARWGTEPTGEPGPADYLLTALAACLLKGLERARAMMPFEYTSAEVTVTGRRQDTPPRFVELEYDVRLVTTESEHRVQLLHRNLRQFGTITNTLAAACEVRGSVRRVDGPQPPAAVS